MRYPHTWTRCQICGEYVYRGATAAKVDRRWRCEDCGGGVPELSTDNTGHIVPDSEDIIPDSDSEDN